MKVFVGHDPGKEGWVSWIDQDGNYLGSAQQPLLSKTKGDTYDRYGMVGLVREIGGFGWGEKRSNIAAWTIEEQQPGAGVGTASAKSIGMQQRGYGYWLGILAALEITLFEVRPQAWRKHHGVTQPRYPKEAQPFDKKPTKREKDKLEKWKAWEKRERQRLDKQRKEGLAGAVKRAQQLFPGVDLRRNEKCKVPSPDKAISLLLADYGRSRG